MSKQVLRHCQNNATLGDATLMSCSCLPIFSAPDRKIEVAIAIVIDRIAIENPEICDRDRMATGHPPKKLILQKFPRGGKSTQNKKVHLNKFSEQFPLGS